MSNGFKEKLKEERSGILAWLVRGCLAWQRQGLAIPPFILLATEKYRDEEDNILQFLNERCIMRSEASVKASVLYEAYKGWCEENQFGRGMNATLFGNEISRRFEKKTTKSGRLYQGVGVLAPGESGEGLVKGSDTNTITAKSASEANADDVETGKGEGCEGFRQFFPPTAFASHSIGQNREKPFTPFTSSTIVNSDELASEANGEQKTEDSQPFTRTAVR